MSDLTVIGIDESMTATGISVVVNGKPVESMTVRLVSVRETEKGTQLVKRVKKYLDALKCLLQKYPDPVIGIERTDWLQPLRNNSEWRQAYKRERVTQEALGQLQGATAAFCLYNELKMIMLGVREWRIEFGAGMSKDAVADMLAKEYPSQIEFDAGNGKYYWLEDGHEFDNNQSDAMGIALVTYNRVHRREMELA